MDKIPVVKKVNKTISENIEYISPEDILYSFYIAKGQRTVFKLKDGSEAYWLYNYEHITQHLMAAYKFERVDRESVVNISNASHFDENLGNIYFTGKSGCLKEFVTVALKHTKRIKALIQEYIKKD